MKASKRSSQGIKEMTPEGYRNALLMLIFLFACAFVALVWIST